MRNLVVLGASNVTKALPLLWSAARHDSSLATRMIVVAGHGRSYGLPSTFLGRTLPSILQSSCWETLDELVPKDAPLEAVVTDVGNDILYGASPSVLGCWLKECVDRLGRWPLQLTMTELPLASLSRMSKARFLFFRSVFFPGSTLRFEEALGNGAAVNAIVRSIATEANARLIQPPADWYGIDPIHIRRTHRHSAWSQIFPGVPEEPTLPPLTPLDCWRLARLKPAVLWRSKQEFRQVQPVRSDRISELWLY